MKRLLEILIQLMEVWLIRLRFIRSADREVQLGLMMQYRANPDPENRFDMERVGFNVYSPTYEDGALVYIFSLVGFTNRKVLDIGAGPVRASTTANLIVNHGFTGLLLDGNPRNVKNLRSYYAVHPNTTVFPPTCVATFVTAENVNQLAESHGLSREIDLLCIDIDGVDYWIWNALEVVQPRVVVVEYQDNLGPERAWTVPYQPDFDLRQYAVNRVHNNYCGASLGAFVKLGRKRGYRLVGVNRGGWNAFFVREDLCGERLPEVRPEDCFGHAWNRFSMKERFPLVARMKWEDV